MNFNFLVFYTYGDDKDQHVFVDRVSEVSSPKAAIDKVRETRSDPELIIICVIIVTKDNLYNSSYSNRIMSEVANQYWHYFDN